MSTNSLDITVRPRRVFGWPTMIGGGATAGAIGIVIGLLTAELFFLKATNHPTISFNANVAQPIPASVPAVFKVVPSPVIETNPRFFFGTGDGSGGYYAERPMQ